METNAKSQESDNRRRAQRMRTLKGGKIIFPGGYSVFDCVVRNLSATGAMLALSEPMSIPSHFELVLEAANARRPCTVRWRSPNAIGVSFDDAGPSAA